MRNHERPVPDVDVRTFGPLDYVRLVSRVRGDDGFARFFPLDEWHFEIEAALASLSPLRRFVLEAHCRGKSLLEIARLVGWSHHERARQIEGQAYRLLRTAEKGGPLLRRMKEFREQYFCEFEVTETREPYQLGCNIFMMAVRRCKFCQRRDTEGDGPRCVAKPSRQMELRI
jgi:hypothetical protein